jgi:hypothetical protein
MSIDVRPFPFISVGMVWVSVININFPNVDEQYVDIIK